MTCRDCGESQHGRSEIEMLACQIRWVLGAETLPAETVAALEAAAKMLDTAAEDRAGDAWVAHAERADSKFW